MASLGDDGGFTGRVKLPLPDKFSGQAVDWDEWSWNFKAYLAMFDSTSVLTLERIAENPTREITDDDFAAMLDALDVDHETTAKRTLLQETALPFSTVGERVCAFSGSPKREEQRL